MSKSSIQHQSRATDQARKAPVGCAVLTVSDTRTEATDEGGPLAAHLLESCGHQVRARAIVQDEPQAIGRLIEAWLADSSIQAIVTTGGTGISARDTTIEVVRRFLTLELDGFGELFRMLSFQRIKGAAMLSRAVGGLATRAPEAGGDTLIFAVPGALDAVETAVKELIAPQLAHLVWHRKGK